MEFSYFKSIAESLTSVKRPGFFATGGKCSMPLPSLSISSAPDVVLGLPLGEDQVKSVIDSATAAPFCVSTWQLSPSQFSISNPEWDQGLEKLLEAVDYGLACDVGRDMSCELSKLLLCEDGGSIKLDRCTEGTFGTLVIQLPSNYEGGELVVSHGSKMEKFNFDGAAACTSFHYAAFYADCQHEIKPVTKGRRLCLVYNLVYRGSGECLVPANNETVESSVASSMQEWGSDQSEDCPLMMTYLLDGTYPEASLSFQLLKNTDRAVADVLVEAEKLVDFDLYLGQLSFEQNWSIEYYRHSASYDKLDLNEETAAGKKLVSSDNEKILSQICFMKNCIVPEDFLEDVNPDREVVMGDRKNVILEYKRTALMLWPSGNQIANLGFENTINQLSECVYRQLEGAPELAKGILHAATLKNVKSLYPSIPDNLCEQFLCLLQRMDNVELISEGLTAILDSAAADHVVAFESFSNLILDIGSKHGWNILASPLHNVFGKLSISSESIGTYCSFLERISGSQPSEAQKSVCQSLASILVGLLISEADYPGYIPPYRFSVLDCTTVYGQIYYLMKSLVAIEHDEALLSLVEDVCAKPKRYPVKMILIPVLEAVFKEGNQPLQVLVSHCISFFEERTNRFIPYPSDWSQSVDFSCSCKDCTVLVQFLEHPTKKEERFKMGQQRRLHLENNLRANKCSVSFTTDRTGSTHSLVVTKTRAGYEKDLEEQEEERGILSCLRPLLTETASAAASATVTVSATVGPSLPPAKRQRVDTNY